MKNVCKVIVIAALLHLAIAPDSYAAFGYTSLSYSGDLSGYSQTWMDPFNTIDEQCQTYYAYGQEWFDCFVIEATGVTVEGQLVSPASTVVQSDSAYDWYQATINYWVGAPVQPGTWTAAGSHTMEANGHAYYCLPFQGCGDYPIGFMSIFLGYSNDQETVLDPCAVWMGIAVAVVNEMSDWPELHFERSANVQCTNGIPAVAYRRDSFNEVFEGAYSPTRDPCRVSLVYTGAIAGMHSHPLFTHEDQMNDGVGCHGVKTYTHLQINSTNNANQDFTLPADGRLNDYQWFESSSTDFYLLVPTVDKIKRMTPNKHQSIVWPLP